MGKFARVIDLENNEQVLLTVNYNNADKEYELEIRTEFNGSVAMATSGFDEIEGCMSAMENFNEKKAIAYRNDMAKMFD